jgi:hypothetical protein
MLLLDWESGYGGKSRMKTESQLHFSFTICNSSILNTGMTSISKKMREIFNDRAGISTIFVDKY